MIMTEGRTVRWARLYDLGTSIVGRPVRSLHQRILQVAAIAPGERLLDVGCGPGRLTIAAATRAGTSGEALGIDAAPEMIALAREKARRSGSSAQFRAAAIEAIPVVDDYFDVVLANLMLHHLPPELQRRGVAEVFRVLKPNGRFVVGEFRGNPGHTLGHLLRVLGVGRGSEHAEHLRALEQRTGFESVQIEPVARAFCVLKAMKPAPRS